MIRDYCKEAYSHKKGEMIDRFASSDGIGTSPLLNGLVYSYDNLCNEKGLNSTYGLIGSAAPWYYESMSSILANGGAGQINTLVSGNVLKQLGILKER